jgi:hypothetical protein
MMAAVVLVIYATLICESTWMIAWSHGANDNDFLVNLEKVLSS